jgi:3-oxoacyl-[acyl-carrier protein] reductase
MDLGLSGRKALLSGASRGLGRACAQQLAKEGVAVTIVARNPENLERAAAEIRAATGGSVTPVVGDITTEAGRKAAVAACPAPDILVNNADGPLPGNFRDWTRDDWIQAFDTMTLAHIEMIKATVDGMIERRFGRIVNITSRSVKAAHWELGLSNAARSALTGFVAGLARETVRHNVTINNLLPGPFATDAQRRHVEGLVKMTGKSFDEIWRERGTANPAGRFGEPAELGAYCAFLCSVHCGYVTGQNLLVDGGGFPGTL